MFGLTKREQRWNAELKALELAAPIIVAIVKANAAEEELARLRAENAELRKRAEQENEG